MMLFMFIICCLDGTSSSYTPRYFDMCSTTKKELTPSAIAYSTAMVTKVFRYRCFQEALFKFHFSPLEIIHLKNSACFILRIAYADFEPIKGRGSFPPAETKRLTSKMEKIVDQCNAFNASNIIAPSVVKRLVSVAIQCLCVEHNELLPVSAAFEG